MFVRRQTIKHTCLLGNTNHIMDWVLARSQTHTQTHTRAHTKVSSGMWPFPKSLPFLPQLPSPSGCVKTEGVKGQVLGGWRLGFTWLSTFVGAGRQKGNVQEGSCVCLRRARDRVRGGREKRGTDGWMCGWSWSLVSDGWSQNARLKRRFLRRAQERNKRWEWENVKEKPEKPNPHSSLDSSACLSPCTSPSPPSVSFLLWPCGLCVGLRPASVLNACWLCRSLHDHTARRKPQPK